MDCPLPGFSFLDLKPVVPQAQLAKITEQVLRSLVNTLQFGDGQRPFVGGSGDLDGVEEVAYERKNSPAATLEGCIDVSAPLDSGVPESSAEYTRVYFRASLSVRVKQGNESGQGCADDGAQKAPDGRFHKSSPGVDEGGVGASDSTHGGNCV